MVTVRTKWGVPPLWHQCFASADSNAVTASAFGKTGVVTALATAQTAQTNAVVNLHFSRHARNFCAPTVSVFARFCAVMIITTVVTIPMRLAVGPTSAIKTTAAAVRFTTIFKVYDTHLD